VPAYPLHGVLMGCPDGPHRCRASFASKLRDAEPDGTDWEARCPSCHHGGFRISAPKTARYRHIWVCACKRCKCSPARIRAALLALGVSPGCLGSYGTSGGKAAPDPAAVAMLTQAVDDILAAPRLKPSDMRVILAEARGHKVPTEFRAFVRWAMSLGMGRSQAYDAAARWCRPADQVLPPGGGGR
jgi:hypothetical protein